MTLMAEYRMEPIDSEGLPEWTVELEVGHGVGRNFALLTDLRKTRKSPTRNGHINVSGAKTLTLNLDDLPTWESACETCDSIALALLAVPGKAKPADTVTYVIHDGLTAATAHQKPAWQHKFRYAPVGIVQTAEASIPWWKAIGISDLDDTHNPRRKQ